MTATVVRHTVTVEGKPPEMMMKLVFTSDEHCLALQEALIEVFGSDRVRVEGPTESISLPVPVARISEFWALINDFSRRYDFTIQYQD